MSKGRPRSTLLSVTSAAPPNAIVWETPAVVVVVAAEAAAA